MAGSVLLDTNVVVAHLRGQSNLGVRSVQSATLFLPWVVVGELHYGAHRSRRRDEALRQIADLQNITVLLLANGHTAAIYGEVKAELARVGSLIPDNDILIAALARQYKLPLATRDRHFAAVPGLQTLDW